MHLRFTPVNSGPSQHGARGPGTGPTGFKFHSGSVRDGIVVIPSSPARSTPRHQGDGSNSLHRCVQFELGSQLGSRSTRGRWSASQRSCHINVLEIQAVIYAVRDFLPRLRSWVVRLMCDNAVTVAHIKNEGGGARDRTLWCRWPYGCSSAATARQLRWFPSFCQECTTSRLIPCPETARHWPRSGRWPWRVYDPCMPSGASYGSTCLRHSPTDDSSSSYRRIRTPGRSRQMPCPCLGTTGGTFLYAFPSFKMVPQVLQKIAQSPGVEVILIAQLQPAASWFPELMNLSQEDPIPLFVEGQDLLTQDIWTGDGVTENRHFRPSNLHAWKLSGPSWEQRVIPGKLPTWCQGAFGNLHNKCMNPIGQDSWRSVGRKDGTWFESEVIISAPTWCTSSGTDYFHRR